MSRTRYEWTSISDVSQKFNKKWESGIFLRELIEPGNLFPLIVSLKIPRGSELIDGFEEAREWIRQYHNLNENVSFNIEWIDINHRTIGSNKLPKALHFTSTEAVAVFIGKKREYDQFKSLSAELLDSFPDLKRWVLKFPLTLIDCKSDLQKLIRVTYWILDHPLPNIYLRQLSLYGIDTKFIESYKKILGEWFDFLLDPSFIIREFSGSKGFEKRFGFLTKPELIRFRVLDEMIKVGGFSDITVRVDEFCELDIGIETVFITENDINGLTFPNIKKAIVLFGRGYGFSFLKDVDWLKMKRIIYWGDIDTHGFAILSQFRTLFPHAESMLMDRDTFMLCCNFWVREDSPGSAVIDNLTSEELSLYSDLRNDRLGQSLRLEQEYVPSEMVENALQRLAII